MVFTSQILDSLPILGVFVAFAIVSMLFYEGGFKFGQTKMPDDMQAKIDQIVSQLKANPNGGYIEIEGHTDNVGNKDINYKLGLDRAEAVKRYLYESQQIPLHKINVISYGEEKPIAPNKTKDGRAQNRRVVIKVLA